MLLNKLGDETSNLKSRKRVGRGIGSGTGKTCGKGHKGQKSRSGVAIKGFEGGQMPIHRRLPKRGFNPINRLVYQIVNLADINRMIQNKKLDPKKPITMDVLQSIGFTKKTQLPVKLLSSGEISYPVKIELHAASAVATKKVSDAGGNLKIIPFNKVSQEKPEAS